tara:strand:+ start:544 stop:1053 length:510 start_codon:yes stop_codon:yes gene_type:complete
MTRGNNHIVFIFCWIILTTNWSFGENKILSAPLTNLDQLQPSFENIEDTNNNLNTNNVIKNKKKDKSNTSLTAKFIGLDKITAKTSEIIINLGETKKFGPLEIKVLKCGKLNSKHLDNNSVAYLQVKDLSKNDNEKVFIFNGWTFSSDPTLAPFDHAIYDLQLVQCNNV